MIEKVISFVKDCSYQDIPRVAKENSIRSFIDILGVAASATQTELSKIIRQHCASYYLHNPNISKPSSIWFDGRLVNSIGATLANAMTIDALDAHDGQKLTKGHVGCGVVPSLIAFMQSKGNLDPKTFLSNLIIGYEIGTRAGISLHRTTNDYHTSGAWISLACAGIGSNILNLSYSQTREAFGIAEYHGPRSQMMRCIDHPSMVKDGSGWGAMAGVNAAFLAKNGFTGSPAITIENGELSDIWSDLGNRWYINEQYLKLYPVCRWAQPAVEATFNLKEEYNFKMDEIDSITINTFHEAKRLESQHPSTTEEAQYSLPHPVAVGLIFGKIGAKEVSKEVINNEEVSSLREKINVTESEEYNSYFPEKRFADAIIKLNNDKILRSVPTEAKGDPENPLNDLEVKKKYEDLTFSVLGMERSKRIYETITLYHSLESMQEVFSLITEPIN